jgi:hypothetical protein
MKNKMCPTFSKPGTKTLIVDQKLGLNQEKKTDLVA